MHRLLKIDIVSDVSCPWCIIGYSALSQALDKLAPTISARLAWKPFELNPDMPAEGQPMGEHLHEKYGSSKADIAQARNMITARGAALGFQFNFSDEGRIYNTFNAHRLLYWARQYGKQTELKLALFKLYFTDGGNPGNAEALVRAAAKAGLPADEARKILDSDRFAHEVREEEAKYLAMGIHSVPTFIINDKYRFIGGQPVDEFVATLEKIVAEETASDK
ncbi:MAG TPA: DsbA family oxidoreductase [Gallionellaceae bacterium]|nr:DsbA family oxidoreductase [Gallionellaceae bacterium]